MLIHWFRNHWFVGVQDITERQRNTLVVYYDFDTKQPSFRCGRCNKKVNVPVIKVSNEVMLKCTDFGHEITITIFEKMK